MLTVGLTDAVPPGHTVTLVFDYTGPVSSEDDSPTRGVRFASVDKTRPSAAALALVSADELSDEPIHRHFQGYRAGHDGGCRHGQSRPVRR